MYFDAYFSTVHLSFESVFDVARNMIPNRDFGSEQKLIDLLNRSGGMDQDTPICFFSCNYETFIVREDDFFIIDTCWNHPWDIQNDAMSWCDIPEYIKLKYFMDKDGRDPNPDHEYLELGCRAEFWLLDCNLFGQPLRLHEIEGEGCYCVLTGQKVEGGGLFCPSCSSYYWEVDGEIMCPSCSSGHVDEGENRE